MEMPKSKGGMDDNKYNRHPNITHTSQLHKDIVMCETCMYVCDVKMPILCYHPYHPCLSSF